MSKFVKVQTALRDLEQIKGALEDINISFEEDQEYRHRWSKHQEEVPLIIEVGHIRFGLRPNAEGIFEAIGDDMELNKIQSTLQKVAQRYAYRTVLAETEKAGFDLVEEREDDNQVIRLTVRRWR